MEGVFQALCSGQYRNDQSIVMFVLLEAYAWREGSSQRRERRMKMLTRLDIAARLAKAWRRPAKPQRTEATQYDSENLKRLTVCAYSGYFHNNDVAAPFMFVSKIRLKN